MLAGEIDNIVVFGSWREIDGQPRQSLEKNCYFLRRNTHSPLA